MDNCCYCRREVAPGARTCEDCADYETAVRTADHILQDCELRDASLAASLGAEIMREYFLRSVRGARARHVDRPEAESAILRRRPLV
jgi:hypothetical protein